MSSKFIDAHEAARWVASGDTVCTVGMTLIGAAESILSAIEARFLTAGEPRDLTLLHAAGQSDRQRGIQHFAHPGMVTRLIGSHWGLAPRWMAMINNNEVEAWCLPQGRSFISIARWPPDCRGGFLPSVSVPLSIRA
ncbi:bifunctional putative acetyl-CoA:acetoacetyl-CoA transferase: alpha subunit/beta subunit [Klebsiella pneumoniae]|nr:bifunctional putative acetyl-CoA:acetoacetyl-CoA transferase: alpha subunit/beta subunit [Klebsiella pneumoniae]